jgi:hypothetical protein
MRRFAGIELGEDTVPDESTIPLPTSARAAQSDSGRLRNHQSL